MSDGNTLASAETGKTSLNGTDRYEQKVAPQPQLSRAELEARLRSTSESITSRVEDLQHEVEQVGQNVKEFFSSNPIVGAGLSLAAGLAVGYLIAGIGSGKARSREAWVDAVSQAIAEAVEEGDDPKHASEQILRAAGRIDANAGARRPNKAMGLLAMLVASSTRLVLGAAMKQGLDRLSAMTETGTESED